MQSSGQYKLLRCWPQLHEHIYVFFALIKMAAVEREHAFSVLKCYILKGNYHGGLETLSLELELTSTGGRSRVTGFTPENCAAGAKLSKWVTNWRAYLLYAVHSKALMRLTFPDLHEATTGVAALSGLVSSES